VSRPTSPLSRVGHGSLGAPEAPPLKRSVYAALRVGVRGWSEVQGAGSGSCPDVGVRAVLEAGAMADHLLTHRHEAQDAGFTTAPFTGSETAVRDDAAEVTPSTTAGRVTDGPRELAFRQSDGIQVRLVWHAGDSAVWVSVNDDRSGDRFSIAVAPERALHAFHHPFAYAA
jgi:hypothetical protein